MKFSVQDLLLADAIRTRAADFRRRDSMKLPEEQREAFLARPANDYIKEAWDELHGIAGVIRKLEVDASEAKPTP